METVGAKNRAWDHVDEDISVKISCGLSLRPFAHIEIILETLYAGHAILFELQYVQTRLGFNLLQI